MGRPKRNIFLALEILQHKRQGWTELDIAKKYGWAMSKGRYDPDWKRGCSTVRRYAKTGREFLREYLEIYIGGVLLCYFFLARLFGFFKVEFDEWMDSERRHSFEAALDALEIKLRVGRRKYRKLRRRILKC